MIGKQKILEVIFHFTVFLHKINFIINFQKRETSSRSMSATSYYLPTISKSSKTSSKSASTSWKSAQQVINKKIECEANGGEDEALSGQGCGRGNFRKKNLS